MDHMPSPEKVDLMTHAMRPVVSQVYQQDEYNPVKPVSLQCEKRKVLKQILIDTDGENLQEQSGELRGYTATQVGDSIRKLVQFLICKTLNQQLNPDQDEKNGDRKNYRIYVHNVFCLF